MGLRDRFFGFALCLLGVSSLACAGDYRNKRLLSTQAPMQIPRSQDLELAYQARKRDRNPRNTESTLFLHLTPGLTPITWPKNSDMRARMLTPELRRTPVVGWLAQNLYRSKRDNGWCLEVDPGQGEYVVFYRVHLK
ncbi:MAG: hypothetical protein ABI821_16035 [Pseudomonadota bacterium]